MKPYAALRSSSWLLAMWMTSALATVARGDDWPQWRGPQRDGIWREAGIIEHFPAEGLQVRWRAKVGPGFSAPSVADGRVFCTDRQRDRGTERVLAFDETTGRPLWRHEYSAPYRGVDYDSGPRAAPTIHEGKVYTFGTMGHLHCFDAITGEVIWSKDLVEEHGTDVPIWGMSGAPLVYEDLLIVNAGGRPDACLIAFHKDTGQVAWQALGDPPGYSSPVVIRAGGTEQLIFWSPQAVTSLQPQTGHVYWRVTSPTRTGMSIATPVHYQDLLFVTSFFSGSLMLQLRQDEPDAGILWQEPRSDERNTIILHSTMSTPVLRGEHIYGVDSYGHFRAIEMQTGQRVWETLEPSDIRRWYNLHLIAHGDRAFLFNEDGDLMLAKLSPDGYHEIDRTPLIEPTLPIHSPDGVRHVVWSHPAFANKHIFVRNDRELIRASLAEEDY